MDVEVIDNFLTLEVYTRISSPFLNLSTVDWYTNKITRQNQSFTDWVEEKDTCYRTLLCEEKYNIQLSHWLYDHPKPSSKYFDSTIDPFINALDLKVMLRAKVNLNMVTENVIEHGYHVDYQFPHLTAIYYLNTNDGYTKLEDGTKIESVANRLVKLPYKTFHTGTTCSNKKFRCVLNLNYLSL